MRRFRPTTSRHDRSDVGGVADQAALLAILLGGAVTLGLIITGLLTGLGDAMPDSLIPG